MKEEITITAESRDLRGKNEARRLRKRGFAPGVVYGGTGDSVAVAVSPKEVNRILHGRSGQNTIFHINVKGGENTPVMIVDWQHDPIKDNLLHVDLKRIDLSKRVIVKIPVHTSGEPKGVKLQGGLHEIVSREVEIECLPNDIPEQFTVDVSELMIGQSVRASEIPMTESMKLMSPADAVISHVVTMKAEEVVEPVAEIAAPAAAEPEVIKKGKKDEEGAAEPEAKEKKKK